MRPTNRKLLLAVACALMLIGVMATAMVVPRVAWKVAKNALRAAASTTELVAATANAEDLRFESISPESAAAIEHRRARRAAARATASAQAAIPEHPAAPEDIVVPEPPSPPVTIGKTGDIMRVGSDIEVGRDDVVTGDVLAVGGDLTIEGHVEGNAVSMGGDIYLKPTAKVDGDVVCMGGELHEDAGATVGGKRVVGLGSKRERARALRDHGIDIDIADEPKHRSRGGDVGGALASLLVTLLISWAIVKIAPGRTTAALDSFRKGPGSSFLIGWLAIVLTVPGLIAVALLTALLCITIIGIPLGIAVLFAYFLFLAVFVVWGGVVGSAIVGERIAQRRGFATPSIVRAVITGVLVLQGALVIAQMLRVIPFFGGLGMFLKVILIIACALVGVTGWGALLHSEFTTGVLARWWHGRRGGQTPPPAAPAPAPYEPSPTSPGGTSVTTVDVPSGAVTPPSFASPAPPPPSTFTPPPPPASPPSPPSTFMPPGPASPGAPPPPDPASPGATGS